MRTAKRSAPVAAVEARGEKISPREMEELIAGVVRSHRAHTPNAAIKQETITSEHTRLIARALLTGILFEQARGRHETPAPL